MLILPEIANGEDKSSPFINCLKNIYRHLRKWAKRTNTNCFRIYDRQLYHYPFAIDFYAGRYLIHYFCPNRGQEEVPDALRDEVQNALVETFRADPNQIFWRSRIKRKKYEQYEKKDCSQEFFTVLEYGVTFKINLVDYLDTGLFLDHRELRRFVALQCKDKRVLNLFAYTASFSVHAAINGASFTKSVDMSNTYMNWAKENFLENGLSLKNNQCIREDCLKFLKEEVRSSNRYDCIIIDPPTISRSKKMDKMFDVQEDYLFLISKGLELLSEGGVIFFSTNLRTFAFDKEQFPMCRVEEITKKTLPIDFHDHKIHQAWKITPVTT